MSSECSPNVNLEYNDLLGTSFAVTKKHLLTARHVLCEDDYVTPLFDVTSGNARSGAFVISRNGKKVGSKVSCPSPMAVRVIHSNIEHDWALLELVDPSLKFDAWFKLCQQNELPQLDTETVDLKAFFAPIGQYKRKMVNDLGIWPDDYHRVLQYDRNETQIVVDVGLYRGSCGSPYVNSREKVVAMHLGSDNEGENVSLVKPVRKAAKSASVATLTDTMDSVIDQVTDMASVYASTRIGVVLANVPDLMVLADAENAIP